MEQQRLVLCERRRRETIVFPDNNNPIEPPFLRSEYVLTEDEAAQTNILLEEEEEVVLAKYEKEIAHSRTMVNDMDSKRKIAIEEGIKRRRADLTDGHFIVGLPARIQAYLNVLLPHLHHIPDNHSSQNSRRRNSRRLNVKEGQELLVRLKERV
ncbi:hypothetical protein PQX77_013465 [Marasmius sp. AFHP31]|nr:hypothetical protein PQX77_013465 [Marasmius sp. AFHP31]